MIQQVEEGASCTPEVDKNGSLSKATQFNHCLSLHQEVLQKKSSPEVSAKVQPGDPSVGPEHKRMVSPVVGGPGSA